MSDDLEPRPPTHAERLAHHLGRALGHVQTARDAAADVAVGAPDTHRRITDELADIEDDLCSAQSAAALAAGRPEVGIDFTSIMSERTLAYTRQAVDFLVSVLDDNNAVRVLHLIRGTVERAQTALQDLGIHGGMMGLSGPYGGMGNQAMIGGPMVMGGMNPMETFGAQAVGQIVAAMKPDRADEGIRHLVEALGEAQRSGLDEDIVKSLRRRIHDKLDVDRGGEVVPLGLAEDPAGTVGAANDGGVSA